MDPTKALYLQQATNWLASVEAWANEPAGKPGGATTNSGGNGPPPPPPWPPRLEETTGE